MRKYSKRTAIVAVTAVVLLGTAGGAYAYWTSTGSGSGTAAAAAAASTVTVSQTGPVAGLVPGGAALGLSGTFTSPNSNVVVTSLTATVASVDKTGCPAADFVIGGSAVIVNDAPATSSKTWSGLTIKLNNTSANQDACKGAAVTINYATS
ncbi:hypothetical protein [Pengzhenrongella phosphoraccumulans]|uniref:hypothetical protein n=1 Tax=Pengzhenrongella phosphoraccumulans TaxID=3114394 RepID=UPI00388D491C